MRLYRVTWADPYGWTRLVQTSPRHPLYVPIHQQGGGRFDNPDHYAALYGATEPASAVGEAFGNRHTWTHAILTRPKDDLVRVLATFEMDRRVIDLDDTAILERLGLRPSDVVRRDQEKTRETALRLWLDDHVQTGGVQWWSYYRPEWRPVMLWSRDLNDAQWFPDVAMVDVEPLHIDHPAVRLAATVLPRRVEA